MSRLPNILLYLAPSINGPGNLGFKALLNGLADVSELWVVTNNPSEKSDLSCTNKASLYRDERRVERGRAGHRSLS